MNSKNKSPIPWAQPDFWGLEEQFLVEALHSTWISGGAFVGRFERDVAAFSGLPFAISASNGTTAIHLAYLGLGLRPGDEVIVPGFCYLAAANITLQMGAKPVFAEVDPDTFCVTAGAIEAVLTRRTRLVVVVHTYGNVCEMGEIMSLARSKGVPVLEDAAESFASTYMGRQSGAISGLGTYSFQATKTITTGEGGMVVTDDDALAKKLALYRSHGVSGRRYWHELPGHNFRLTNLQAALGCAQLERLDSIVRERKRIHRTYTAALKGIAGIRLQVFRSEVDPVLWTLALELDPAAYPQGRDRVIEQLAVEGIETRNGFYAASQLSIYPDCVSLPNCERLANNVISLPTFPSLSDQQIDYVCSRLAALRA
ncbi:MAG: DegT/DnrJ/EryC1/StrS family aminotransferase [Betaproteobacteria bacterium]|nr:DegT/DnrJ/EryC1/StrS family aminotransferase [Betaproteobacteria bacterium]